MWHCATAAGARVDTKADGAKKPRNGRGLFWFKGLTPAAPLAGRQARSLLHLRCGHLVLDRVAVVALHAILVANHLPVELVDQCVDGGIQVFVMRLDKDVLALEM